MTQQATWHLVALHENEFNFGPNNIAVASVASKKICIAKFNNRLFAFAYKCPHASGFLADGYLDLHGNVVCPLHRFTFNMASGYNSSGEGYYLKTYAMEEREDGWFVKI